MHENFRPFRLAVPQIRKILMDNWDPIGVKAIPEAQDEYDEYAWHLAGMLARNSSQDEIEAFLNHVETVMMGFDENELTRKSHKNTAQKLIQLTANLRSSHEK